MTKLSYLAGPNIAQSVSNEQKSLNELMLANKATYERLLIVGSLANRYPNRSKYLEQAFLGMVARYMQRRDYIIANSKPGSVYEGCEEDWITVANQFLPEGSKISGQKPKVGFVPFIIIAVAIISAIVVTGVVVVKIYDRKKEAESDSETLDKTIAALLTMPDVEPGDLTELIKNIDTSKVTASSPGILDTANTAINLMLGLGVAYTGYQFLKPILSKKQE